MDVVVRYWDENESEVKTRYLTSVFLGHATAKDLLHGFKVCHGLNIILPKGCMIG